MFELPGSEHQAGDYLEDISNAALVGEIEGAVRDGDTWKASPFEFCKWWFSPRPGTSNPDRKFIPVPPYPLAAAMREKGWFRDGKPALVVSANEPASGVLGDMLTLKAAEKIVADIFALYDADAPERETVRDWLRQGIPKELIGKNKRNWNLYLEVEVRRVANNRKEIKTKSPDVRD